MYYKIWHDSFEYFTTWYPIFNHKKFYFMHQLPLYASAISLIDDIKFVDWINIFFHASFILIGTLISSENILDGVFDFGHS